MVKSSSQQIGSGRDFEKNPNYHAILKEYSDLSLNVEAGFYALKNGDVGRAKGFADIAYTSEKTINFANVASLYEAIANYYEKKDFRGNLFLIKTNLIMANKSWEKHKKKFKGDEVTENLCDVQIFENEKRINDINYEMMGWEK